MAPLAVLCLALGLIPQVVMNSLLGVAAQIVPGPDLPPLPGAFNLSLALLLAVIIAALAGLANLPGGRARRTETWGCGIVTDASMEYTAASFSQPVRRVYRFILQPKREVSTDYSLLPYFNYRMHFEERIKSVIRDFLYKPLREFTIALSKKWRCIQCGNINLYLGYIFVTLIILLVWVR